MKFKKLMQFSFLTLGVLFAIGGSNGLLEIAHAEEEKTFLEEDYSTLTAAKSVAIEKYAVCGGNSSHGLVPSKTWSGTINAETGYIIYKVSAADGQAFKTFEFDLKGMARNDLKLTSGDPITLAGFNVYVADLPTNFDEVNGHIDPVKGSGAFVTTNFDFTSIAVGLSTVYVKVELLHTTGAVSLSNCGTKLSMVTFKGTEKESDVAYVTKTDDYTKSTSATCHFDKMNNVGGFNNSNGVVPTKAWTDPITTAKDAYVIYSLATPVGASFKSLAVTLSARAWANGTGKIDEQSVSTAGCSIKIYISKDINNFGNPIKTVEGGSSSAAQNIVLTDYEACLNATQIYIKIELDHPVMKISLSQCGTRLYSASVSGSYLKSECVESVPFVDAIALTDEYTSYEQTGQLKPASIGGGNYLYSGGDKASIIIPIECNSLYKFYNLTYSQLIRCTTYGSAAQIDNALSFSVSKDGVEYSKLETLNTDKDWTKKAINLNLSEVTRGAHKIYVKVEIDWHGRSDSHDWIAIGNISLTGDLLERDEFDIFYKNMEGATNDPDNPSGYTYGSTLTLKGASKDHYSFGGWYLDEEFSEPFTTITSETKGDLELFAKWNPENVKVTLDAGEGSFQDSSKTKEINGNYESPLSRSVTITPSCQGKNFINWFKDPQFENAFIFEEDYGTSDIITTPITLYAKYAISVKVTYDYNDGIRENVIFLQESGQKANTVEDPTLEGYKFGGWYLNDQKYDFNTILSTDIVLKAKWYQIYTITYLGITGATHSNPSIYTNDLAQITLQDAVKEGYTFLGWFVGESKVTSIDTTLQENLTFTAKWQINFHTLTIITDEHSSTITAPNQITIEGATVKVNVEAGYYLKNAFANNIALGFTNDNEIFVKGFNEDVTLVIETAPSYYFDNSIDITFKDQVNLEDYVAGMNNVKKYTADEQSSRYGYLVPQDYSKAGYITYAIDAGVGKTLNSLSLSGTARVFSYANSAATLDLYISNDGINWTLVNSFPSTTNGESMTEISTNLTSYAKGQRFVYIKYVIESGNYDWVCLNGIYANMSYSCSTVKFMDGDNLMYINSDQITGGNIVLIENPTKVGYKFLNWYADSKFRQKIDSSYIVEQDMTVYAKWEAIVYNINYYVGDGASIGDNPETYTSDQEIILNSAEKHNYQFIGWYLDPTLSGDPITKIAKNTTGEVTLFAKFVEGTPITYYLNGGENSILNPEVYFYNETTELFDAYREGYVFAGWYSDSEFKNMVTAIEEGTTGNVSLYAQWIEDKDDSGDKKGCGGEIISSGIIVACASLLTLAALSFKKKER